MLINPLTPVSPMLPVTPVRPVAPPLDGEALLAMAAVAAAEVTDQLGRIAAASGEAMSAPAGASSAAATSSTAVAKPVVAEPEPTPVVLQARAVGAAAAQAAQRQGGLAPLMADLVAVRQAQTLPTPVRAALDQVLALRAPLDGAVTGADVKRALDRSGLFLEARLAAGVAPNDRPGASRAADRSAPPPADLKAALLVFRQVVKTWADAAPTPSAPTSTAPTAAASKALPGPASAIPTPASAAASAPTTPPLAAPAPPSAPMSPSPAVMTALQLPVFAAEIAPPPAPATAALQPPLAASGGSQPAAGAPSTPPTAPMAQTALSTPIIAQPTPTASPVAAVAVLATPEAAETLAAFEAPDAPDAPPHAAASTTPIAARAEPGAAPLAGSRSTLPPPPDPPAFASVRDAPASAFRAPPEAGPHAAATPPPPYRDGPTSAQPAAAASLAANADAHTVAHHLLRETGAALARQELLQIASLPEPGPATAAGRPVEDKGARWMFDVPFMTPQGAAVAQFEISRDGGGGGAEYEARQVAPVWRARFSLDVEPMGPVHAQIALSGERARVSLWAERPASMARLMAREPMLSSALREAELTPEVAFHAGAPQRAPAAPGKFVDQAS